MKDIRREAFAKKTERSELLWGSSPTPRFPTISLTGKNCDIKCDYCKGRYLKSMVPAEEPDTLYEKCVSLCRKGARGVLLSGGFNERGYVPFEPFIDAISAVREETDLFISVHSGLVPEKLAADLGKAGVGEVNFDMISNFSVIDSNESFETAFEVYRDSLYSISEEISFVAPHILLGLFGRDFIVEKRALETLSDMDIDIATLVFLIIIPPTNSSKYSIPKSGKIGEFLCETRLDFPDTPIALGCMRPRSVERIDTEIKAIEAGVDRIVTPSKEAINFAVEKGLKVKKLEACCSVPEKLARRWGKDC